MQYQHRLTVAPKCLITVSAGSQSGETGWRRDTLARACRLDAGAHRMPQLASVTVPTPTRRGDRMPNAPAAFREHAITVARAPLGERSRTLRARITVGAARAAARLHVCELDRGSVRP